jgi:hypothetical protein
VVAHVQDLLICHLLDVMHCEKNLCKNIVRTIYGEKDYPRSRMDMMDMGIRQELHLQRNLMNIGCPVHLMS